jgi:hypothetical protein
MKSLLVRSPDSLLKCQKEASHLDNFESFFCRNRLREVASLHTSALSLTRAQQKNSNIAAGPLEL